MTRNNKKGFTLAELLIVVAIIGVLVAISIPIFTKQLRKARLAANQANARAAYASAVAQRLDKDDMGGEETYKYDIETATAVKVTTKADGDNTPIDFWTVDSTVYSSFKMGDKVADTWYVSFLDMGDDPYYKDLVVCFVAE